MLRGVIGSTIPFEGICFGSTPNEAVIGIVAKLAKRKALKMPHLRNIVGSNPTNPIKR